ncbi:hypothetical protein ED733_005696 [Metarhizium rileyi]|uniref:Zn(2)-C6 fungal-type domain-containing protein n=1 Tax=Metarhizium rileyi (strain RCEF 4871) TaxID=1649241 RepID=A0A5C6GKP7_METRR|nr:hypothetical protein ED733_005696 [Metarhizium rileyi]
MNYTVSRTTPSHSHTEAGTLRKRAQRACSQCHSHKTKCSGDLPRCKRCEAGGLPCEYTPAKRRFTNVRFQKADNAAENPSNANPAAEANVSNSATVSRSESVTSPASSTGSTNNNNYFALITEGSSLTSEEMLVRRDILLRHVDAYMDNMYWLPCQGFLHPDTTYREIQEGIFDPIVAAAVCGITAVFVSPSDSGGEFGVKCSSHVEMYLFQNIYKFSDDLLVLFALSITFNLIRGEFAKLWQSFGVASRLMLGLRVNWDVLPRNQTFAQQECLRRIAWQLFYLDRMLAGGYEEYISCRAENMQIALPCSEAAFRENRPINAERLYDKPGSHPSTINLHAYQLRLIDLRHRIQVTTKRLCSPSSPSQPQFDASKVMADINRLQNELTRFHMSLPPDYFLSDQSVAKYMSSPERAGYVFLHTHLAVSHIDLYRFSLPGQRDKVSVDILRKLPKEFIARSQKQAVAHAMCLGRFCDAIQNEVDQMPDTGKLELAGDYSTFQMSTQCVRVLLVALQYQLYRDIADVTTAPLWRSVEVDEAHIQFLISSVQRVTRPWCDILNVAQQAYDHNVALVEEFTKTRKVADQRAAEAMFGSKSESSNRLTGPDAILESIATGKAEEYHRRMASPSPSDSTRWIGSHPSPPGPNVFAAKGGSQVTEAILGEAAPGIPLFLAQARHRPGDATQGPLAYDADYSLMPMGDLDAVLPDTNPLVSVEAMPMSGMHAGGPSMFQHAIPQPSAGFLMAQQSVFGGDAHVDHYVNRQYGQGGYSQPPGGYQTEPSNWHHPSRGEGAGAL